MPGGETSGQRRGGGFHYRSPCEVLEYSGDAKNLMIATRSLAL
ncbi:hypothetical protein BTZ20_1696 [Rhodococcus sp. MTM3W5.2]|nr:hypothetical protein BTZ20_1696 [Rhodococcus sp. MTM3W5.2]